MLFFLECKTDKSSSNFYCIRRIGVRLGAFDEDGKICDYGTENCTIYQQFGVNEIIVHSDYIWLTYSTQNDIALIRLDRSIRFTEKMKPICLPFGSNHIREPNMETPLTVSGWGRTMEANEVVAKREATIYIVQTTMCHIYYKSVDDTQICAIATGQNSCNGDSGGPLMQHFQRRRMVLEGIVSFGIGNCTLPDWPGVYTRVRSFGNWLDQKMRM